MLQIIRVKNCSGPKPIKWIGAWHKEDTRWANVSDSIRRELDSETFHDGGFWMAYGDFLKYFQVTNCLILILNIFKCRNKCITN